MREHPVFSTGGGGGAFWYLPASRNAPPLALSVQRLADQAWNESFSSPGIHGPSQALYYLFIVYNILVGEFVPLPKNSWPNTRSFQFLVGVPRAPSNKFGPLLEEVLDTPLLTPLYCWKVPLLSCSLI